MSKNDFHKNELEKFTKVWMDNIASSLFVTICGYIIPINIIVEHETKSNIKNIK